MSKKSAEKKSTIGKTTSKRIANKNTTKKGSLLSNYHNELQDKLKGRVGDFLYRGQENAGWQLRSGAVRRIFPKKDKVALQNLIKGRKKRNDFLEFNLTYHKEELIEQAKIRGWHREISGRELKDLELLAKLQHQGAATCLLDFTTRFDVALWFACKQLQRGDEDGKVFIVDLDTIPILDLQRIGSKDLEYNIDEVLHFETRKIEEDVHSFQKRGKPKLWYWHPETLMGRMLSQESRFLFGLEDIPSQGIFSREEHPFSIRVKKEDKEELLLELKQHCGLSHESIVSDIQGFTIINNHEKPFYRKGIGDYQQEGKRKFQRGDLFAAIKSFDKVIELDKKDVDAWFHRGMAKFLLGLEKLVQQLLQEPKLNRNASVPLDKKYYEESVKDFGKVIKLDSDRNDAYLFRSVVYEMLGKYDEARSDLESVLKLYELQKNQKMKSSVKIRLQKLKMLEQRNESPVTSGQGSML